MTGPHEVLGRVFDVVLVHVLGDFEVRLLPVRVELVLEEVEVGNEPLEEGLVHGGVEGAKQREDRDTTFARNTRAGVGRLVLLLF